MPKLSFITFLTLVLVTALYLTPTSAIARTCLRDGDVNQDGKVTTADALLTFLQFLGIAAPPLDTCTQTRANVHDPANNSLTPGDVLCIFRLFLGLPSCFGRLQVTPALGGSVVSQDGLLMLTIPPGAVSADTDITITVVTGAALPSDLQTDARAITAYSLEPAGLTFSTPVTVTIQLSEQDLEGVNLRGSIPVQDIWLRDSTGQTVLVDAVQTEVDVGAGTVTATGAIDHFSMVFTRFSLFEATLRPGPIDALAPITWRSAISVLSVAPSEQVDRWARLGITDVGPAYEVEVLTYSVLGIVEFLGRERLIEFTESERPQRGSGGRYLTEPFGIFRCPRPGGSGSYAQDVFLVVEVNDLNAGEGQPLKKRIFRLIGIDALVTCRAPSTIASGTVGTSVRKPESVESISPPLFDIGRTFTAPAIIVGGDGGGAIQGLDGTILESFMNQAPTLTFGSSGMRFVVGDQPPTEIWISWGLGQLNTQEYFPDDEAFSPFVQFHDPFGQFSWFDVSPIPDSQHPGFARGAWVIADRLLVGGCPQSMNGLTRLNPVPSGGGINMVLDDQTTICGPTFNDSPSQLRVLSAQQIGDDILVVMENQDEPTAVTGELWWTPAAGPPGWTKIANGDLGETGASVPDVQCHPGRNRCFVPAFQAGSILQVEYDPVSAAIFTAGRVLASGRGVIGLGLADTDEGLLIASAGSLTQTIHLEIIDEQDAGTHFMGTFNDCIAPSDVAILPSGDLIVACSGSDNLRVVKPSELQQQ